MTTAQFITEIEAKPQFIKWAKAPAVLETVGDVEKWNGIAYVTTPNGTNTLNVFFMVDAGQATWQQADPIDFQNSVTSIKMNVLLAYLKTTFVGYFVLRTDLENNWAEAEVFTISGADLVQSKVLVYKLGNNPIAHKKII